MDWTMIAIVATIVIGAIMLVALIRFLDKFEK